MKYVTESNCQSPNPETSYLKRISWGAIFAGFTTAVMIQLLLTLLGIGIGAATVNPLQESNPGAGLAMGGVIWFFASSLLAMYVGGRIAGQLSNGLAKSNRMHHGIFTWGATVILSAIFLTSAMSSLLGSATGAAVGGRAVQATPTPVNSTQVNSPVASSPTAVGISETEARQAGAVAAERVSQTALATFFLLLMTGIAAALGGRYSARQSERDEEYLEPASEPHVRPAFSK